MLLNFTKMHGLGNDFIVIDASTSPVGLSTGDVRKLADRHFGVGCDQLLLIEPPRNADTDFFINIFNTDGSETGQCGNGMRCIARFIKERGLADKTEFKFETIEAKVEATILGDNRVRVNMGVPRLEPGDIPFQANGRALTYALNLADEIVEIGAVSMGNPHAVMLVEELDGANIDELGEHVSNHERFPERANAGFMQMIDRGHIKLRV
ncbi:MAG: diaminopimelate epimerase, partial [Gammaproteobacteria bacterium]|nr:diaminopimelate epimerase [Gammaproteobacteria bacterium]